MNSQLSTAGAGTFLLLLHVVITFVKKHIYTIVLQSNLSYHECSLCSWERTIYCFCNLCPIPLCFDVINYV